MLRNVLQAAREHAGVLDRHVGALAEERQHGVTGVAQKTDPAHRPLRQGIAEEQTPFVELIDAVDDVDQITMPAWKIQQTFFVRARLHPGFQTPVIALDFTDHVEKPATVHRIAGHVAVRAKPLSRHRACADAAAAVPWQPARATPGFR